MNRTPLAMLVAVAGLVALGGCGTDAPLDAQERARVEAELFPRFHRLHGAVLDADATRAAERLAAVLQRLQPEDAARRIDLRITAEADADALCLPGDRLVVSRGLLAWVGDDDEAAAVLAAAMSMCPAADATWRDPDAAVLPGQEDESFRMLRYIDARLAANAVLYRLAVADACGGQCARRIPARLDAAGFDGGAFGRLVERVAGEWPEALWLERVGAVPATRAEVIPVPVAAPDPDAVPETFDDPDIEDWSGFGPLREGLVALSEVRREIGRGRLLAAYRASNRARSLLDQEPAARRLHAELELHNNHPFYARDLLEVLERQQYPMPDLAYLRGWMQVQLKEYDEAEALLTPEMDAFPRVAGLYQLAVIRAREREHDQAESLLTRARAAGPINPYLDEIEWLEQAIERRRARER